MQRLDDSETEKYVKVLVYGKPGSGKTSFGETAPNPLILLTERQGMVHIRQAAVRNGRKTPPVFLCESIEDLKLALRALLGDKSKPFAIKRKTETGVETLFTLDKWPESVVLDSMTEIGRLLVQSIEAQSPSRLGSDGLPTHTQNYWGVGIGGTEDDGLGTGLTKAVFGTVVVGGGGKSGINLDGAGVDATGVARIVSGLVRTYL
jgi:hypothetical protein